MPPETSRAELVLEARDVYKYFGDLAALKGIGLRLVPGDSVLLWGPNGAGKTTLLRALAGLLRPSQGEVLFAGQSLHRNPGASRRRWVSSPTPRCSMVNLRRVRI